MGLMSGLQFAQFVPIVLTPLQGPYFGNLELSEGKNSSDGSGGSKKTSLYGLDSAMVEHLYKLGLASDVATFLDEAEYAIKHAYDPKTGLANYNAYKIILPGLALITTSKKTFEESYQKALNNGALGEMAITGLGLLVVLDSNGKLLTVSPQEMLEGEYRPLSNGELSRLRSLDPRTGFNDNISSIIGNGTSMKEIADFIRLEMPKLGTSTTTTGATTLQLQLGADALNTLITNLQSVKNSNLIEQALLALKYIAGMMPGNMATLLQIKAASLNTTAEQLLLDYLGAEQSNTLAETTSDKLSGGSNKLKGNAALDKLTPPMAWLQGYGAKAVLNWHGSGNFALQLDGTVMGVSNNGKDLLGTVPLSAISTSDFGSLLNMDSISFGDELIKGVQANNVIVDSTNLYNVVLPIDIEAALNGIIKPDMKLLDRMQVLDEKLKRLKITDPEEINKYYALEHLPVKYAKKEGSNLWTYTGAYYTFGAMNAYATLKAFSKSPKFYDRSITEVTDENERLAVEEALKQGKANKDPGFNGKVSSVFTFMDDVLYKSVVYIPVKKNWANALQTASNMPTNLQAVQSYEYIQLNFLDRQDLLNSMFNKEEEI